MIPLSSGLLSQEFGMNWNTSWILATILSVSLLSECAAQQAQELVTFKEISQKYGCVTFSPDSTTLAAWGLRGFVVKGDREVADGAVWLWDVPKRKRKDVLQVGGTHADSVAFSSDGKLLAVGCSNGTVQVWDSGTGKKRSDLKGHTVGCGFVAVAFPKDSNTLVSGAWDGTVRHWDVPTGKEKEKLRKTAGGAPVAVTQDGKTIASGGQLSLFDCGRRKRVKRKRLFGDITAN
jgi:WD40 repeat protein